MYLKVTKLGWRELFCAVRMQEVVSVQDDHERLLHIQKVIKELPTAHFRWTFNFLNFNGCKEFVLLTNSLPCLTNRV